MKVKTSTLALTAGVLPALLFAYPGFGGGKGLFRVQNATVEQEAGLTVSFHALARNADFDASSRSGWVADLIAPELSYANVVTKYVGLELFGSWGGVFQAPESPRVADGFVLGLHDLKAGAKLSIQFLRVLKLGGTASYTFRPRDVWTGWQMLDPSAMPAATRLSWGGLVALRFQDITLPAPNLIINVGRHVDNLRPRRNETYYGAAVEMQGSGFALFAEAFLQEPDYTPSIRKNQEVFGLKYGHMHVTPGIVIGSPTSVFLKFGYTISVGGESLGERQPNELMAGVGLAAPFGRRKRREYGRIVGAVVDDDLGTPLAAMITFPDHPKLGRLKTDPRTGTFKAAKVPVGAVTVEASADGYESRSVPLMVESGRPSTATIMLPLADTAVAFTGSVSDRRTGEALAATVVLPDADSAVIETDPATGVYMTRLMPGGYSVVVESPGYLKQTTWVLVERNKPLVRDFRLVVEGMVITLRGIYFDFNMATITPESRPALEDAAKILIQNPTITVEIHGHTDSIGSDQYNQQLSERRAAAVVNYLVQDLGIEASRLTAKGYGESLPVADNSKDEGRASNRRVEFVITGQTGQIAPDR